MPDGVCNPVRNLYLIPGRSLGTGTTVQKNASLNFCTPDFIMPDGVCNPVRNLYLIPGRSLEPEQLCKKTLRLIFGCSSANTLIKNFS